MKYRLRSILALILLAGAAFYIVYYSRAVDDKKSPSAQAPTPTQLPGTKTVDIHATADVSGQTPANNAPAQVRSLEWVELMPAEDLALIESMTPVDHASMSQSELDKDKSAPSQNLKPQGELSRFETAKNAQDRTWKDALVSTRTRAELNQQLIKIAGFVVPLVYDSQQQLTEFFLVPYFGACIHVPPPPPNQIIYVRLAKGMPAADINIPVWLEGRLKIETMENALGLSSYSMEAQRVWPYTDE